MTSPVLCLVTFIAKLGVKLDDFFTKPEQEQIDLITARLQNKHFDLSGYSRFLYFKHLISFDSLMLWEEMMLILGMRIEFNIDNSFINCEGFEAVTALDNQFTSYTD